MSYILDALRRADSERERGSIPSIHSPPAHQVSDEPKPQVGNPKALVWVIVALLLALAGLLAWHLFGGKASAPSVAADNAVSDTPLRQPPPVPQDEVGAQNQAMAPAAQPAPQTALPTARQTMPPPMAPAPQTAPMQPQFQPPTQRVQQVPQPSRQMPPPSVVAPVRSSPPTAATTQPTAPEADTRVYATSELPANIQRELPKVVVGGAMYSDTPANRMLIINSQVFREGDKLATDLVLQEIKLKSAVFKYKGYRYGVSY